MAKTAKKAKSTEFPLKIVKTAKMALETKDANRAQIAKMSKLAIKTKMTNSHDDRTIENGPFG